MKSKHYPNRLVISALEHSPITRSGTPLTFYLARGGKREIERYRIREIALVISVALGVFPLVAVAKNPLTVAVSVAPQAWLVRQIGGGDVRVVTMVAPGDSPHSYQPTDQQVSEVMRADLYLQAGIPFERGQWFRAIAASGRVTVVDMRAGITQRSLNHHAHHDHEASRANPHEKDPHIWLDPRLLQQQAQTIAAALQKHDPDHAAGYGTRLADLLARLSKLDQTIRTALAPYQGKPIFVFHPAWGYFCDAYGLRQLAVEIEGKEPTDFELTGLQRLARRESVKVVFVQPQITSRSAKAVAQTIGARVVVADPLSADVIKNLESFTRAVVASFE